MAIVRKWYVHCARWRRLAGFEFVLLIDHDPRSCGLFINLSQKLLLLTLLFNIRYRRSIRPTNSGPVVRNDRLFQLTFTKRCSIDTNQRQGGHWCRSFLDPLLHFIFPFEASLHWPQFKMFPRFAPCPLSGSEPFGVLVALFCGRPHLHCLNIASSSTAAFHVY